jgi:uncharacterized protein GlcG (DUF336 family)
MSAPRVEKAAGAIGLRGLAVGMFAALTAMPALADQATWSRRTLLPEVALRAAQAAQAECRAQGWQATVTVADPSGLPIVTLRDRFAGWHTIEAAAGKARTAASWREATSTLAARVGSPDSAEKGIMHLPGVVMIGGGLPIEAAGQLVGAIGVSGAPGGAADDTCAKAGIAAIEADLEF